MNLQATKPQEEVYFKERADTFQLSVTLVGEQRLMITLKDFVDWIIYQKKYSDDDVGKEIHKKMNAVDVYTAFAQTKPQCDEESIKKMQNQGGQVKKYQFGTMVENADDKLPCYKIERGGRITAYLSILDIRAKKQAIYQSKLILNKVRDMTETEISTQRSTFEKKQIFSELSREIQKERKEKEEFMKRVIKLQEENERVKEELRITKQEMNQTNLKLNGLINLRIEEVKQQFQENLNVQNQRSQDKFAKIWQNLDPMIKMLTFMTLPQSYRSQFKIQWFKVQYTGSNAWTHHVFNSSIRHNSTANFIFRIAKTQKKNIMVGVVDFQKQREQRNSGGSANAMCYYGLNGYKYPSEGQEGGGFKQNDVVRVDVNRATSTIKYIINGETKATHINNMLADNSRDFLPFVQMYDTGDCVECLF